MATNVTEKDKTLNEIMAWCDQLSMEIKCTEDATTDRTYGKLRGLYLVYEHCQNMLGYSGSMPSEVPNQSEEGDQAKRGCEHEGDKPMNGDKQHAVWRESIEKYGKTMQSIVCMEECSELIQAVSKRLRGKPDATDNLAEEMADVTICLYLLKEMYGITDEQLEEWIARKTARQSKRMQADDPFMEGEDTE